MSPELRAEERTARLIAASGLRSLVVAMVVVGMWCQVHPQREPWEILWVGLAAVGGMAALDYLVRVVTRTSDDDGH